MSDRPRATGRRLTSVLLATLVVASAITAGLVAATSQPLAWIDQPLPGAVLAFGSTPVTVHAASASGIAKVRFLVDGKPAAEVNAPTGDLVTVLWTWVPAALGQHLLTAIAVDTGSVSSVPTSAAVTFVAGETLPPPPTPGPSATVAPSPGPGQTATPTRTPSPTRAPTPKPSRPAPTPTPCALPTATLIDPSDGSSLLSPANPQFTWDYRGSTACVASQRLHIDVPAGVGPDQDIDLAAGARSYSQRSAFVYDPTDPSNCGHYHWYVVALDAHGNAGAAPASFSFDVCL